MPSHRRLVPSIVTWPSFTSPATTQVVWTCWSRSENEARSARWSGWGYRVDRSRRVLVTALRAREWVLRRAKPKARGSPVVRAQRPPRLRPGGYCGAENARGKPRGVAGPKRNPERGSRADHAAARPHAVCGLQASI